IPIMPVVGPVDLGEVLPAWTNPLPSYASPFSHLLERAEAGYYAVTLLRYDVEAELTATVRAGFHRYRFPAAGAASVVIDVTRDLKGYQTGEVTIIDATTVTGSSQTTGPEHTIHFAARFDRPFVTRATFAGTTVSDGSSHAAGAAVGAVLGFGDAPGVVQVKVGISYVDVAGALANLDAEVPGWDFAAVRGAARAAWNEKLGAIEVEGGTLADRRSFYTALYHAELFPNVFSDVDGRYRGFDDAIRIGDRIQYTQFSLWDSYRGQNQLLAVLEPAEYRDMIESLMNDWRQSGSLPRWALANRAPNYMSGDPVIPFIGEAWCRGLIEEEAKEEIFGAMREAVERRPATYLASGFDPTPRPANPIAVVEGGPRNAGTTLEYGIAEFSLALMADEVGRTADRDALSARALNYRNLLDPETRWIRPRHDDGSWLEAFLPENGYGFQEGTSWQYSWLAMQDLRGLFDRMGGNDEVNRRLDVLFGFPLTATVPVVHPKLQNTITVFG
ncbi:MAG: GH92 family glycosyl hydrolase, partial [Candidatus Binatia bacterium]